MGAGIVAADFIRQKRCCAVGNIIPENAAVGQLIKVSLISGDAQDRIIFFKEKRFAIDVAC